MRRIRTRGRSGVLEYWSTGVLEYWSTGVLEFWSTGVLEYWSTGVLEYWSTGVLARKSPPQCRWKHSRSRSCSQPATTKSSCKNAQGCEAARLQGCVHLCSVFLSSDSTSLTSRTSRTAESKNRTPKAHRLESKLSAPGVRRSWSKGIAM